MKKTKFPQKRNALTTIRVAENRINYNLISEDSPKKRKMWIFIHDFLIDAIEFSFYICPSHCLWGRVST